jgi:hypothetical protein
MVHNNPASELQTILDIVLEHPDGIGISALENALAQRLGKSMISRTLQRKLNRLIDDQQLSVTGKSVSLVYKPGVKNAVTPLIGVAAATAIASAALTTELYVPTSAEGALVRDHVRQALMHRRPVGYQREFLEAYKPGETWYLSESTRAQLHEMGRTPADELPAGTYARDILQRLLVDLSWASSRLEGNTYSRLDTQNLIEFGKAAQGKDAQETQMILNHKAAIEMLIDDVDEVKFDAFTLQNLHAVLSQNLMREEAASGRLRRRPVEISGTVFHPLAMPQMLEDFFRLLLAKTEAIPDPFEQAFFLMVQLPYLQPFEDVNKRVSRLAANIPLIKQNLCPLSFIDVPQRAYVEGTLGVYELNQVELLRDVFVWAYERSCQRYLAITQTMVDPDPMKIQYRDALIEAVQTLVKAQCKPTEKAIAKLASKFVPKQDQGGFARLLTEAIRQLHEGSVARYRLKRSEYLAWQSIAKVNNSKS